MPVVRSAAEETRINLITKRGSLIIINVPKKKNMTDVLKQCLSEVPLYSVEKETGVQRASLLRFVRGDQSIRLDIADRLAEHFGIEVTRKRKRK